MLVMLVGPPAVGKMTVGHALAARTGLRLFHNHQTIDLVLRFFPFGTPPFRRLNGEFRRRIFEEVAASDLPGLIFTYAWAFDDPRDHAAVEAWSAIFRARGGRVVFAEGGHQRHSAIEAKASGDCARPVRATFSS
jgi:hypothetical protein